jgi:hypothetical protein
MKSVNHGVSSATSRFRSKPRNQSATKTADRGKQHEQPRPEGIRFAARCERLSIGTQRDITNELLEKPPLEILEPSKEGSAHEARG